MKKTPSRQCISCRVQLPRDKFIRLLKTDDIYSASETIIINPDKKKFGRSAYLCLSANCIKKTIKERKVQKVLKVTASTMANLIPALETFINVQNTQRPVFNPHLLVHGTNPGKEVQV